MAGQEFETLFLKPLQFSHLDPGSRSPFKFRGVKEAKSLPGTLKGLNYVFFKYQTHYGRINHVNKVPVFIFLLILIITVIFIIIIIIISRRYGVTKPSQSMYSYLIYKISTNKISIRCIFFQIHAANTYCHLNDSVRISK